MPARSPFRHCVLLSSALWLASGRARAEGTLSWAAPTACAAESEVLRRVADLLGRPEVALSGVDLSVSGSVSAVRPGSYALDLTLRTSSGERRRRFVSNGCDELVEVAALMIAVAIDPAAPLEARAVPSCRLCEVDVPGDCACPPPCAQRRSLLESEVRQPVCPSCSRAAPTRVVLLPLPEPVGARSDTEFMLGGSVARGTIPWWAPGAVATLSHTWGEARFGVGASYASAFLEANADVKAGARFGLSTGNITGCWLPHWAEAFRLCGGGEVGLLEGQGLGVDLPERARGLWLAAIAGPELAIRMGQGAELAGGAEAIVPFARPVFELRDEEVYQSAYIGARLWLGVRAEIQ